MSCFNDDRATLGNKANKFDEDLTSGGFDEVLNEAFKSGMNLDEIMYVVFSHTERTVRRYIVQEQLKRAANKEK